MLALIRTILTIYLLLLFGRIALSWFPPSERPAMQSLQRFLFSATEPVLAPLRAILPPVRMGGMALDLSPTVLIFGIFILLQVLR